MYRKPVVGILGFSDGEPEVHEQLKGIVQAQVDTLVDALRAVGALEVIVGDQLVSYSSCSGRRDESCRPEYSSYSDCGRWESASSAPDTVVLVPTIILELNSTRRQGHEEIRTDSNHR
jgi:hypothetical protein